mmetsp:Transcript_24176/g.26850  ORF Transcript_24176/g.26850 Transcript_24176/m.26850 type:complete len:99 (-) Transcript_24176:306-602(-)
MLINVRGTQCNINTVIKPPGLVNTPNILTILVAATKKIKIALAMICIVIIFIFFSILGSSCTERILFNTKTPVMSRYNPEAIDAMNKIDSKTLCTTTL